MGAVVYVYVCIHVNVREVCLFWFTRKQISLFNAYKLHCLQVLQHKNLISSMKHLTFDFYHIEIFIVQAEYFKLHFIRCVCTCVLNNPIEFNIYEMKLMHMPVSYISNTNSNSDRPTYICLFIG